MSPNLLRLLTTLVVCILATQAGAADPALDHFERKIRPVLIEHCYECHSAAAARQDKLKGGLQLDTREGIRRGGDSGPSVVPGKPKQSLLLSALRFEDVEMPPQGRLSEATIRDFETWIESGAMDPRDGPAVEVKKALDFAQARQFWSLRPIARHAPPAVKDAVWAKSDIDRFVLARLEREGLAPSGDAADHVLVRRLYFDLHGLPPSPAAVEAFVEKAAHDRDSAVAALVDHLLASPHFGERWGRHWLDVIRYAESNGRDINVVWHHAWRYRDWVLDAFNGDLPFDQFVRLQVAGDLLPAASPEERDAGRIATGMLAMSPKLIEETNQAVYRMDLIDEQIDVLSRAFLGLSVSCARCHDHKFDPIPTRDYYALAGMLQSSVTLYGPARLGTKGAPHSEYAAIGPNAERLGPAALAHWQQLQAEHLKFQTARSDRYRVVRKVSDLENQLAKAGADKARLEAELAKAQAEVKVWDARVKELEADLDRLTNEPPPQPDWAMGLREAHNPRDCRVHIRGETANLGDEVPRGVLQIVAIPGLPSIESHESGRRQLAEWLASPQNPLTPRVAVNRVWLHLFGRGLVTTPDDFGQTGARPTHPELLDHLADRFVAEGWSVKKLVRKIATSRTYRLASTSQGANRERDPDVTLLWRKQPKRLEAEAFRDAALAVAGQLQLERPAPYLATLNPYKDHTLWPHQPFVKEDALGGVHRSFYIPVLRSSLPELFSRFDFADPHRVVGQRDESVVPAQALFLLNHPWMIEQARHTARRLLADESLDDAGRIGRLYQWAFARQPQPKERAQLLTFLEPEPSGAARLELWVSLCQAVLASSEFRYVE